MKMLIGRAAVNYILVLRALLHFYYWIRFCMGCVFHMRKLRPKISHRRA
jgi:hypothetical protein